MHVLWLVIFAVMQAAAQVIFKYGAATPGRWLPGFIGGNVFGASSIWFLMLLYKTMNPNVALGLATAGGFLCAQAALAILFRSHVSLVQWTGMLAIAFGMALVTTARNH
ncbi:MAG: hypothetical protein JSV65_02595 [Armatimonadota bacterium]|nr:MAG: hypothetical protein JSV65_02595 [Armatimonadota bacterium]